MQTQLKDTLGIMQFAFTDFTSNLGKGLSVCPLLERVRIHGLEAVLDVRLNAGDLDLRLGLGNDDLTQALVGV